MKPCPRVNEERTARRHREAWGDKQRCFLFKTRSEAITDQARVLPKPLDADRLFTVTGLGEELRCFSKSNTTAVTCPGTCCRGGLILLCGGRFPLPMGQKIQHRRSKEGVGVRWLLLDCYRDFAGFLITLVMSISSESSWEIASCTEEWWEYCLCSVSCIWSWILAT